MWVYVPITHITSFWSTKGVLIVVPCPCVWINIDIWTWSVVSISLYRHWLLLVLVSAANISKTLQFTPGLSGWMNSTAGKNKNLYVWFGMNCSFVACMSAAQQPHSKRSLIDHLWHSQSSQIVTSSIDCGSWAPFLLTTFTVWMFSPSLLKLCPPVDFSYRHPGWGTGSSTNWNTSRVCTA